MSERIGGISLERWLKNPTPQGLPRKSFTRSNSEKKPMMFFWYPNRDEPHLMEFEKSRNHPPRLSCTASFSFSYKGARPVMKL